MNAYQRACGKVAMRLFILAGILLTVFLLVNQPPKFEGERKPWLVIGFKELP